MSIVEKLIKKEEKRQRSKVNLIASENLTSPAIMRAMGSVLTNKYAEGYPGARYYGGCEIVDEIENHAIEMAKKLFGAEHANVQPHSGSTANMAAYMAVLQPGDTILAMHLDSGGHLTHGAKVNFSGKLYNIVPYGLDENGVLDYKGIEELAKKHKPKLIQSGYTAYSLQIDFERLSKIAKDVGAIFMVDMAHIAGLVATGHHPSPVPHADIVTSTTHKTLRGPRGGLILCKSEYAKAIDKVIMPGIQGGPLMSVVGAKAICFEEALQPSFKKYIGDVVANTAYLCNGLKEAGLKIVSGGTQNHLFMIDLSDTQKSGKQVQEELDAKYGIVCNKNKIQGDKRSAVETSGIRIGLPFITNFKKVNKNALDELKDIIVAVVKDTPVPEGKLLKKIFR
jgi:glycine hydroxymethyltransferase